MKVFNDILLTDVRSQFSDMHQLLTLHYILVSFCLCPLLSSNNTELMSIEILLWSLHSGNILLLQPRLAACQE